MARRELAVDLRAVPHRLDRGTLYPCDEHVDCALVVEHHVIEMHLAAERCGVRVEPAGVVRVEVHTNP